MNTAVEVEEGGKMSKEVCTFEREYLGLSCGFLVPRRHLIKIPEILSKNKYIPQHFLKIGL